MQGHLHLIYIPSPHHGNSDVFHLFGRQKCEGWLFFLQYKIIFQQNEIIIKHPLLGLHTHKWCELNVQDRQNLKP